MTQDTACPEPGRLAVTSEPRQSLSGAGCARPLFMLLLRALIAQSLVLYLFYAVPAQRPEIMVLVLVLIGAQLSEGGMRILGKASQATLLMVASANFASAYGAYLTGGLGSALLPWALVAWIASLSCFRNAPPKLAAACGATLLGLVVPYLICPALPEISPRTANILLVACPSAAFAYLLARAFTGLWGTETNRSSRNPEEASLEQLTEKAESADRQTTRFFTEANHAIRTPLDAIIGYSEMILEDGGGAFNADNLGDVQRIQQATGQMLKLVSDVFDLSEIEKRQQDSKAVGDKGARAETLAAGINNPSRAFS